MGRFYKTARAQFKDYAFEYPSDLLFRAIAKKDAEVDQDIQSAEKIRTALMAQEAKSRQSIGRGMYLHPDMEAYQKEIGGFESEIDEITQSIYDDPLGKPMTKELSDVRSRISASMTSGNLAMLNRNYMDAKQWLEANKKVDQEIVSASFNKTLKEWGGTIDEGSGGYKMIEPMLPDVLYDDDPMKKALYYSGKVQSTLPEKERFASIHGMMKLDEPLYNTLWQNLGLGLLEDDQKNTINPEYLDEGQKRQVVNDKIREYAELVSKSTTGRYKPSTSKSGGSGSTKTPKIAASGIYTPDAEGLYITTPVNKATSMFPKDDITDASINYAQYLNANLDKEQYGNNAEKAMMEKELALMGHYLDAAKWYANDKIDKEGGVPEGVSSIEYRGKLMDEYLKTVKQETPRIGILATLGDDWEEPDATKILDVAKKFVEDETKMRRARLRSSDADLDFSGRNTGIEGFTMQGAMEQGLLTSEMTNQKAIDKELNELYDKYVKTQDRDKITREMFRKEMLENGKISFDTKTRIHPTLGTVYYDEEAEEESLTVDMPIKPEYSNKFSNFEITGTPELTRTVDERGIPFFRVGALYNGRPTDILIPVDEVGSTTFNNIYANDNPDPNNPEEVRKAAIGMELYYNNMATRLYEDFRAAGLKEGEVLDFGDNYRVRYTQKQYGSRYYPDIELILPDGSVVTDTQQIMERFKLMIKASK